MSGKRTIAPQVEELRTAAKSLAARADRLSSAVSAHLEATADYWTNWLPREPTAMDKTALLLARAVNQTPEPAAGQPGRDNKHTERNAHVAN